MNEKAKSPRRDQLAYEVAKLFQHGESINDIAKAQGISRQNVASLLQRAFTEDLVRLSGHPDELSDRLRRAFGDVRVRVINSRSRFNYLAAEQVLQWLQEVDRDVPSRLPFVAIGGGKALRGLVGEVRNVLGNSSAREMREAFKSNRFWYINATAGGRATAPGFEASHLACLMEEAVRDVCGFPDATAAVFTTSGAPSGEEQRVLKDALANTCAVVSGIGGNPDAYCITAMREKGLLTSAESDQLAAEFLYHLFRADGSPIPVGKPDEPEKGGIRIMELATSHGGAGDAPAPRERKRHSPPVDTRIPTLATLFKFESLQRPTAVPGRRPRVPGQIIAVATCDAKNKDAKVTAAYTLLRHNYLTHVCLSTELATGILSRLDESK